MAQGASKCNIMRLKCTGGRGGANFLIAVVGTPSPPKKNGIALKRIHDSLHPSAISNYFTPPAPQHIHNVTFKICSPYAPSLLIETVPT